MQEKERDKSEEARRQRRRKERSQEEAEKNSMSQVALLFMCSIALSTHTDETDGEGKICRKCQTRFGTLSKSGLCRMEFMKLREVKTDVEKMSGTRAMPPQYVRIGSVVADLREPSWTCPSRVDVAKKSSAQVEEVELDSEESIFWK